MLGWAYRAPQPGMFWRRDVLAAGFDENWRFAFDHELYIRLLLAGHRCRHLPLPVAAYRLHPSSMTVSSPDGFEREFDAIAEYYEPRVDAGARRRSRATRRVRRSSTALKTEDHVAAIRCLLAALADYPPIILGRPFWGCLRRCLGLDRAV